MTQVKWTGSPWLRTHVHPRVDPEFRKKMMVHVVASCGGAVLVLNFDPPVSNAEQLEVVAGEFNNLFAELGRPNFQYQLAFIVTPHTTPQMIADISGLRERLKIQMVAKFFPIAKNGTTGAQWGLDDFWSVHARQLYHHLRQFQIRAMFHAETPDPGGLIPLSQRERLCVPMISRIRETYPDLPMTVAHISTLEMTYLLRDCNGTIFGEITPQHLRYTVHDTVGSSQLRYMPRSQYPADQEAIIELMLAGLPNIGAADDFAPHDYATAKCCVVPANGTIFAPGSELAEYAEQFRLRGKLHHMISPGINQFDAFLSGNAAHHYGFERRGSMELTYDDGNPWTVEALYDGVMPANAGETEYWRLTKLDY